MTRLYVVRHGETEWNKQNRTQGCSNDLPLSQTGKLQAKALAQRFSETNVDVIYSSDLKRAYDTAEEVAKITSLSVNVLEELREMNFGCWEGLTVEEIRKNYSDVYEIWRSNPKKALIPMGETLVQLQQRALKKINEILDKHQGKNIVIVSHGIYIKILILSILGMDISYHNRMRLDNASLNIIDYKKSNPVLTLFNDICHLGLGGNFE